MKKLFTTLLIGVVLLFSTTVFAGIKIQSINKNAASIAVTLICEGANPTVSSDDLSYGGETLTDIIDLTYFYQVCCAPGPASAPPDDGSDLLIFLRVNNEEKVDILGSEDNTTAYHRLNIIDSTTPECAVGNMYIKRGGEHVNHFWLINDTITIDVDNQDTASGIFTMILTFVR